MGSYIGPNINNDGIILSLDPLNNKCYDENNSSVMKDLSGYQPDTNVNSATVSSTTGIMITTGTELTITSPDLSTLTSQLSCEFWIEVSDTTNNYSLYFTQNNGFGDYGIGIRGDNGYLLHYLGQSSGSVGGWWTIGSNASLNGDNAPQWTHVVSTLDMSYTDATNRWAYVNGVLRNSTTQAWTSSSIPVSTNQLKPSRTDHGNRIAFMRMYNRVLSADEVLENYQMMRKRFK